MAGETIKSSAVCLSINPWSKTSHIVQWLTPTGRIVTVVKGAERPKSFFLGQYDLNYTCEILYYARAKGEVHALREAYPLNRRDALREDYRSLALAGYYRLLIGETAPMGSDAAEFYDLLETSINRLLCGACPHLAQLLEFEVKLLKLMGLGLEISEEGGELGLRGERRIPVSAEVAAALKNPLSVSDEKLLIDSARVIGVYYAFHVGLSSDIRRSTLALISK